MNCKELTRKNEELNMLLETTKIENKNEINHFNSQVRNNLALINVFLFYTVDKFLFFCSTELK